MLDNMEIITENARQTQKLGEKIALDLIKNQKPAVIGLYGDLGSGKTTFIQGLAQGLGITKRILSPTFIISRQYQISNIKSQISNFYHFDLYRIENEGDARSLGLEEIFNDQKNIVAIEWPEKIEKILPENTLKIKFEYLGEDKRKIIVFM